MNLHRMRLAVALGMGLLAATGGMPVRGEEATGVVQERTEGNFKLVSGGVERFFQQTIRGTQYEPEAWRPGKGDMVRVQFMVKEDKLVVTELALLKPGAETITDLVNPVAVEIAENMGEIRDKYLKARLYSGHRVDFICQDLRRDPVGWVPKAGEKAVVEFKTQRNWFDCGVTYSAVKVTKMDGSGRGAAKTE